MSRLVSSIFRSKSCLSFKVQSQLYLPMPSVASQLCTASGHCRSRSCTWLAQSFAKPNQCQQVSDSKCYESWICWILSKPEMCNKCWEKNKTHDSFWRVFDILGISSRPCPSRTWRWSPPAAAGCVEPWRWPPSAAAAPHPASRPPSCGPQHSVWQIAGPTNRMPADRQVPPWCLINEGLCTTGTCRLCCCSLSLFFFLLQGSSSKTCKGRTKFSPMRTCWPALTDAAWRVKCSLLLPFGLQYCYSTVYFFASAKHGKPLLRVGS